jgi:aspartyl-tRNA(Asn)/glutamyl-tRNA(Gln) amidotransferase subunit A
MDDEMSKHFDNFMEKVELIRSLGATVDEVSIDQNLLNAIPSIYQVISCAEATSNMSNLTGFIFGPRGEGNNYIEQMTDHRTKGFSSLIKRRFIIGSYVLQAVNQERYFKNAQKARRLLVDKFLELFKEYDALVMPVSSGVAKKFDQEKDVISEDDRSALEDHLQIGNFGGFPSITIPDGFVNGLPVGINFTCNRYEDQKVLNIAYSLESNMEYKNQIAKEVK